MKLIHLFVGAMMLALLGTPLRAQSPLDFVAQGDYATARSALAAGLRGRPDLPLHAAFLEGVIAMREGRTTEAIDIFRRILAVEPRFEPARRELMALLAATGQWQGAVYQAERLLATTEDDRLKASLGSFITQASQGKPHGVALRFAVLPSSNANGGTDADVVYVGGLPFVPDPASRAQSAVGLSFGLTAWNRWTLSDRTSLTGAARLDARIFDNPLVPDEVTLGADLDLGLTGTRGRLSFGPRIEVALHDGERYRDRIGLGVSGQFQASRKLWLGGALTTWRQTYDRLDYQNGYLASGQLGATWIVRPDLTFSLGLPFTIETTRRPHLDHHDFGLALGIEKGWSNGLITGLTVSRSKNRYDGLYPGFPMARRDTVTTAALSLRHRDIRLGGLVPELTLTGTDADSNIGFHRYRKLDVGISFTQRF